MRQSYLSGLVVFLFCLFSLTLLTTTHAYGPRICNIGESQSNGCVCGSGTYLSPVRDRNGNVTDVVCALNSALTYYCGGTPPSSPNTIMCPGDTTGLTVPAVYQYVGNSYGCTNLMKCEYYFNTTPAPIYGVCSSTHDNCVTGISSPGTDDATSFRWLCVASNGGTTAYCSQSRTTVGSTGNCRGPDSTLISNGASKTYYQASSVPSGSQCVSQSRTCSNTSLDGSYQFSSCSIVTSVPTPTGSCTGTNPVNSLLCKNDNVGLTSNASKTLVSSCSSPEGSVPKCEFVCDSAKGYEKSGDSCVLKEPNFCGGNFPTSANKCPNADKGLDEDYEWTEATNFGQNPTSLNCTYSTNANKKCLYYFTGKCTNSDPKNSIACKKDNNGVVKDTPKVLVNTCSVPEGSVPKCEFICKDKFSFVDGTCVDNSKIKVLAIVINFNNASALPIQPVIDAIAKSRQYYIDNSFGKFDDLKGEVISVSLDKGYPKSYMGVLNYMKDARKAAEDLGYKINSQPYVFYVYSAADVSADGVSYPGYSPVHGKEIFIKGAGGWTVYAHEFGHYLGLDHRGSFFETTPLRYCAYSIYNPTSVMGGHGSDQLNAWERKELGYISGDFPIIDKNIKGILKLAAFDQTGTTYPQGYRLKDTKTGGYALLQYSSKNQSLFFSLLPSNPMSLNYIKDCSGDGVLFGIFDGFFNGANNIDAGGINGLANIKKYDKWVEIDTSPTATPTILPAVITSATISSISSISALVDLTTVLLAPVSVATIPSASISSDSGPLAYADVTVVKISSAVSSGFFKRLLAAIGSLFSSTTGFSGQTDANGFISFGTLSDGTYKVTVSKAGFVTTTSTMIVKGGKTTPLVIELVSSRTVANPTPAQINVPTTIAPFISSFSATPSTVAMGGSTNINWAAQRVGDGSCALNYSSGVNIKTWPAGISSGTYTLPNIKASQVIKLRCNKTVYGVPYTHFLTLNINVNTSAVPVALPTPTPTVLPIPTPNPATSVATPAPSTVLPTPIPATPTFCYAFTTNLTTTSTGIDVRKLHAVLGMEGITVSAAELASVPRAYGVSTQAGVSILKAKYAGNVLPASSYAGGFNAGIRTQVNAKYACNPVSVTNNLNQTASVIGALGQNEQSNINSSADIANVSTTINSCVSFTKNIQYRDNDTLNAGAISPLQGFLRNEGYLNSELTGYFGDQTFQAVKSFQTENAVEATGYVGSQTRAKIEEVSCR